MMPRLKAKGAIASAVVGERLVSVKNFGKKRAFVDEEDYSPRKERGDGIMIREKKHDETDYCSVQTRSAITRGYG